MGIMITYHGYDNPVTNVHKSVAVHHTLQTMAV